MFAAVTSWAIGGLSDPDAAVRDAVPAPQLLPFVHIANDR